MPFSANGVGGSYLAQEGVYEFGARDWGPQPVRSLLLNNSDALLTIVTAKDANINTAADFKGKRVAWVVGAPSLNQNITALLAFANLTWNDVKKVEFGGFGQAMDGIVNNQVDAAFSSTISGQAYKIASSPRGIRYPTFPHNDKEGWARVNKIAPFFVPAFGTEGAELSTENKAEAATYPYPVLMTHEVDRHRPRLQHDQGDGGDCSTTTRTARRAITAGTSSARSSPGRSRCTTAPCAISRRRGVWTAEHQKHNDALIKRQDTLAAAWDAYKAKASVERR